MIDPASGLPPKVIVEPPARRLLATLSPEVTALIGRLLQVMERSAQRSSVPISRTELLAHRDPEEGTETVEIRQWVHDSDEKTMDLWDRMGHEIDQWVDGLPNLEADLLAEWVAYAVYSDVDDAAA